MSSPITHVLIASFHHTLGPIVDWAYPPLPDTLTSSEKAAEKIDLPEEWSFLPFQALPDGAHLKDVSFNSFHLPPVQKWEFAQSTVFASSCYRQIDAKELINKTADITRSRVQKAIVVLSTEPVFGAIKDKLVITTEAFFNQKDFSNKGIIVEMFENLKATVKLTDEILNVGISVQDFVHRFRSKSLTLMKLLLLEKKVFFHSTDIDTLATTQYALISLMPELMMHLDDAGHPKLEFQEHPQSQIIRVSADLKLANPYSLKSNSLVSKADLFKKAGFPLQVFGKGTIFQPYLPLQQIDVLQSPETKSYVFGSTNSVYTTNRGCGVDVVVNVDSGTLEVLNPALAELVRLTAPDKKFIDDTVKAVNHILTPMQADGLVSSMGSPATPTVDWEGSDQYVRSRFESYLLSLVSTVAFCNEPEMMGVPPEDPNSAQSKQSLLAEFGTTWVAAWKETKNYKIWKEKVGDDLTEIIEPGHPCTGHTTIAQVQSRLQDRISEMHLDEKKEKLQQQLSAAYVTGSEKMKVIVGNLKAEYENYKQEQAKKSVEGSPEKDNMRAADHTATKGSPTPGPGIGSRIPPGTSEAIQANVEKAKQKTAMLWSSATNYLAQKKKEYQDSRTQNLTPKSSDSNVKTDGDEDSDEEGAGHSLMGKYQSIATDDD